MRTQCKYCKQNHLDKDCPIMKSIKNYLPKPKSSLFGASPPEVFVGRYNYPNVFAGVLAPEEHGETSIYSSPELWHSSNLGIEKILELRGKMIYGRYQTNVKNSNSSEFQSSMQSIALASKSAETEITFKRPFKQQFTSTSYYPIISNQAPLKKINITENIKVENKVDYLVNDTDVKASVALQELYSSGIQVSNITKVLSAGLLGIKKSRKLVPTRWSITAVDDTISRFLLKKIKDNKIIDNFQVAHAEYLGNHYEFILMPSYFSFEVIEFKINSNNSIEGIWQDFESFSGRKKYAFSVTGAYYVNRLALLEYLLKINKQASCLVLRETTPEYWAPLGVGILRETSRSAFKISNIENFETLHDALSSCQKRIKSPIQELIKKSFLVKQFKTQRSLRDYF